jgi:hypothetical protein
MTDKDIIKLAKQAGFDIPKIKTTDPYNRFGENVGGFSYDNTYIAKLTKFAQLLQGETTISKMEKVDAKICIAILQGKIVRNGDTPENKRTRQHIKDIMKYFDMNLFDITLDPTEYEKIRNKLREV